MPKPATSAATRALHALRLKRSLFEGENALAVERLLAQGANPDPPTLEEALDGDLEAGYLLVPAVSGGHVDWVSRLLDHGASPSPPIDRAAITDDLGHLPAGPFNALGIAVGALGIGQRHENLQVLQLLLSRGADPLERDPFTHQSPFGEFIAMVGNEMAVDPGSPIQELALPALMAFMAALPQAHGQALARALADVRQDLPVALARPLPGSEADVSSVPQAAERILGWPIIGPQVAAVFRARAMEEALPACPPTPAAAGPRL